jgi:hypothetical protein
VCLLLFLNIFGYTWINIHSEPKVDFSFCVYKLINFLESNIIPFNGFVKRKSFLKNK